MTVYDLYGLLSGDIGEAKSVLESSLGINFGVRESDYQGGGYFQSGNVEGEHFVLKQNVDPFDGDPAETSFPSYKILFYINDTARSAYLQERMLQGAKDFILLRHENLE
ncbi:hypothetical protein [Achromobacter xylosoxidans]|uniref:hypothetical protein n=1 Tax=Alcaligenes xylosoxydans xylosoxydans TaxID=85698 RepID=UPI00104102E4|nr:hypothetical protein [Achromobacter xylosoxidans]MCH4594217.1 hypothetical protein [Achromobacter xylosoxidans]